MSFERYSAYKESGSQQIGEVPRHWELYSLRRIATFIYGDALSQGVRNEQGNVPVYGSNGPTGTHDSPNTTSPVILIGRKGSCGALNWSEQPVFAIDTVYFVDRTACKADLRWLYWALHIAELHKGSQDTGVPGLSRDSAYGIELPIPPGDEQQAIATFLDRETAKIDALVAEQQRLIYLLSEKRRTVIAHAVTMGLDPTVPMKDSGVEEPTKVPAHWDVAPLKRHWRVTDCKHLTADFVDEGIPVASIREVQSKWVDLENAKQTTEHFYNLLIEGGRRPEPGDLIFSRNATVGEVAQVADTHPPFALGQDVVLLRKVDPEVCSDFLQNVLQSEVVVRQLNQLMIGSTFKRINVEEIRSLIIPFPPSHEQGEISRYLEARAAEFDNLIQAANEAVTLLLERRAALISAAVTGKIDVSGAIVLEAV